MNITILGAGTMASALTIPLTDNGHRVRLWGTRYDRDILENVSSGREHPRLGKTLSTDLQTYQPEQLEAALDDADLVVLGVSSQGVVPVLRKAAEHIQEHQTLLSIAKGVVTIDDDVHFMEEGIQTVFREQHPPAPNVVIAAGPSIAAELAHRTLTPVDFASRSREAAETWANTAGTDYYRINPTTDVRGTEICLGYKNVYSIALSWPEGRARVTDDTSTMSNARSLLFMVAVDELSRITERAGGNARTALARPGLGDFVTTSESGRNGMFGRLLGEEHGVQEALDILHRKGVGVVEGYETARPAVRRLRKMYEGDDPIEEVVPMLIEIHRVLYDEKPVAEAMDRVIRTIESNTDL